MTNAVAFPRPQRDVSEDAICAERRADVAECILTAAKLRRGLHYGSEEEEGIAKSA
jgi:hypothetical protein